jgi:hypothetical protein
MIFLFSGRNVQATALLIGIGLTSFAAFADQVSKAETTVPTITYRSVFRETSLGIEQEKLDWRKANDDVGKFTRGHVDILKQEEMEGKAMDKKAMDAKAMDEKKTMDSKPMPAKPVAPAAPAPHKH